MEGQLFKMDNELVEKLQTLANLMTNGNKSECIRQLILAEWLKTHPQPISIDEEIGRL